MLLLVQSICLWQPGNETRQSTVFLQNHSPKLTCTLVGPAVKTKNREAQIATHWGKATAFFILDAITPLNLYIANSCLLRDAITLLGHSKIVTFWVAWPSRIQTWCKILQYKLCIWRFSKAQISATSGILKKKKIDYWVFWKILHFANIIGVWI